MELDSEVNRNGEGGILNALPGKLYLYIHTDLAVHDGIFRRGSIISEIPSSYVIYSTENTAFVGHPYRVTGKIDSPFISDDLELDYSYVSLEGEKQKIPNYQADLFVIMSGIYVDDTGKENMVRIWYDAPNMTFRIIDSDLSFTLDNVYISMNMTNLGGRYLRPLIHFKRLDAVYKDRQKDSSLTDLKLAITSINIKYSKEFEVLKQESEEIINEFQELDLPIKIELKCFEGDLVFYSTMVPILSNLTHSIFRKIAFEDNTVHLEYPVLVVKRLLWVYVQKDFITPDILIGDPLLTEDILTVYAVISDFLGFDFWARYFREIVSTDEYKALLE